MTDRTIRIEPLTAEAFAPFGQVIAMENAHHYSINSGMTERYHDLAKIELAGDNARPMISIFDGHHRTLPLTLDLVERHPLGSQAFYPLADNPWIVIVAEDDAGQPVRLRAFRPVSGQGVNIAINTWHGVLTTLDCDSRYLVVDRGGDGNNLEEHVFADPWIVTDA